MQKYWRFRSHTRSFILRTQLMHENDSAYIKFQHKHLGILIFQLTLTTNFIMASQSHPKRGCLLTLNRCASKFQKDRETTNRNRWKKGPERFVKIKIRNLENSGSVWTHTGDNEPGIYASVVCQELVRVPDTSIKEKTKITKVLKAEMSNMDQ